MKPNSLSDSAQARLRMLCEAECLAIDAELAAHRTARKATLDLRQQLMAQGVAPSAAGALARAALGTARAASPRLLARLRQVREELEAFALGLSLAASEDEGAEEVPEVVYAPCESAYSMSVSAGGFTLTQ